MFVFKLMMHSHSWEWHSETEKHENFTRIFRNANSLSEKKMSKINKVEEHPAPVFGELCWGSGESTRK